MIKFSDIKYVRPDFERAKPDLEAFLNGMRGAKTYKEARDNFFGYQKIMDEMDTMQNIAYIRSTMDTNDAFYDGEMNFYYETDPEVSLLDKRLAEIIISSPFKEDFGREFGGEFMKSNEAQIRLADESVSQDKVEESKLGQEYSKITADCSVDFRGEKCNFYGLMKHMLSPDRNVRKQAYRAWAGLYESIADKLDAIYDRSIVLRKRMAEKLGFKDYIEMAYLSNGHYFYNADDVAKFREQVVETVVPLASELYERQKRRLKIDELYMYDEQIIFPGGNAEPAGGTKFLLDGAREMYGEISPETKEFFEFMLEGGYFDLETRPGKHMGGYCTFINNFGAPFIFSNFNKSSADVEVLTHEAGHAFQAYCASRRVPLSSLIWSSSDISEIHSMTMELFAHEHMEKFFKGDADKYRFAHLSEAVQDIPYMCLVDHFQHEVYSNNYTAKERRACWRRLEKIYMPWRKYDCNAFLEEGGYWMQKQHIFLYPFYYVDYALAQIGAFEFYDRYREDKKGTWEDYLNLCRAGGSKSYYELFEIGNITVPFAEGAVKKAVAPIAEMLLKKGL